MNSRPATTRIVRCLLALAACTALAAGEARTVPAAVAEVLRKAEAAAPAEALALLEAWEGQQHALILLARGQARWRLIDGAQPQGDALAAAERDFAAALRLDAQLRPAQLGLAQCAAAREDWPAAAAAAGAAIDPATADAGLLAFLATAGLRAGDWRLAEVAAHYGIMRFPRERSLRRIELAVLVNAGRHAAAREAVLALLDQEPGDAQLWRHLAWSAQEGGDADAAVAALEVALALAPGDAATRRSLAQMQAGRGIPQAALETLRPLLAEPAQAAPELLAFAARLAGEAGEARQGLAWLAAVPAERRDRGQRLLAARLAIQAGETAEAAAALDAIIAGGERDAGVLAWAAALAETRGELARAEALYLQASAGSGPAAGPATLRLVALHLRQGRREEARATLAAYRATAPEDAQARALQARLDAHQ